MKRHENILEEIKILVDRTGKYPMECYKPDYDRVENINWLHSEGWTYAMIGKIYGVSRERVRNENQNNK